ncbi:DUF6518 family protein [Actinoplanes regularis]|uniref:Uncharacterized protein n=1 Tax=Actinoplanes regularis TaxID=52697 RepID=A0A238W0R3_9ACTN|nr:DUF6518 family protein [Actinoplanes regularis]GIE85364.1 hypothetical protein Are01nite_18440 [Actinoplanes regularis]SNR40185.1 hypothetical protein SAMN06264365_10264 [Actinoplanes regularis]
MKITRSAALVAPATGLLLGVLDFIWIKYVPFPFGGLGNSIAVWAVAAFLLTLLNRWSLPVSAAAAAGQLVIAVPAYYLAATIIQHDDLSNLYDANAVLWMILGVVAGLVFGAGGALARRADAPRLLRDAALALPGAVLFAEAVLEIGRIGDPSYSTGSLVAYVTVLIVLGLGTTLLITPAAHRRARVLLLALPLTALGYALLSLTGFR